MFVRNCTSSSARLSALSAVGLIGATLLLALLAGACGNNEPEKVRVVPNRSGDRGESCLTSQDCKESLSCVNNTCIKNEYDISQTANQCRRIECESTDDCCELSSQCKALQEQCNDGTQAACDEFERRACDRCNRKCEDQQCVEDFSCTEDAECGFDGNCVDGQCVQCEDSSDCADGAECREGICEEPCELDEECPRFHDCNDAGECIRTGCQSDRECVLWLEDGDAVCNNGSCTVPCQNDAECNEGSDGFFQICEQGTCQFVGCNTDRECRTALGVNNNDGGEQAICVTESQNDGGNGGDGSGN